MYLMSKSSQKQVLNIAGFVCLTYIGLNVTGFVQDVDRDYWDPFETYGPVLTYVLYTMKILTLMGLPITCVGLAGCLWYKLCPDEQTLRGAPLLYPFISIRVVTRGSFPDLVRRNVERNLHICQEFGLDKFVIEVVTDRTVSLPRHAKVREIVVPDTYKTPSGAKFKARALQYALEPHVNILNDDDWIVHLDEETIVTHSALVGIFNFLHENKHQIGQGLITYGKEEVVNWMTTLADSIRVASDMGSVRFSLKTFHKPLYSFKGSFIVCQALVERIVSFDNGLEGSIAEDAYFAIKAVSLGYTFDWIEGEMLEKSPFSFWDFVKQRKRWVQGLYLLVHDRHLKVNFSKIGFAYSFYNWVFLPIQIMNSLILIIFPVTFCSFDRFLSSVNGIIFVYLFIVGALKSFNYRSKSLTRSAFCILGSIASIPYVMFSEAIAVIWGVCSDKKQFFIVTKNNHQASIEV